jgi:hypothetical protein
VNLMGLPEVNITFQSLAISAIQRSEKGTVALILRDDTGTFDTKVYESVDEIVSTDWTAANVDLIKKVFLGNPKKVICERLNVSTSTTPVPLDDALLRLSNKKWNYLAVPQATATETTELATWIKGKRDNEKKTFKAVLANNVADHEGVVNFTTGSIVVDSTTYTAPQYCVRIAGILAGLPFTRSATFFELSEVDSIAESTTPDADIDAGQLILINDGEKIKIGRGVNSLTTTSDTKGEDWKKIKIIEGHDLIKEDITTTFNDEYVGKVNNSYDNQTLFFTSVNAYLRSLEGTVLNPNVENSVGVDIEAQRLAWESAGTDTSEWDEQEVKENSFQSKVFVGGSIRFLDAMEDLDFKMSV